MASQPRGYRPRNPRSRQPRGGGGGGGGCGCGPGPGPVRAPPLMNQDVVYESGEPQAAPVHLDVHIPKGSVKLCLHYGRGGQETCPVRSECALHICHSFLAGSCTVERCRLSHDIQKAVKHLPRQLRDHPPLNILKQIVCPINLRDVIALSFPRLCIAYNSGRGCQRKNCNFLHVCRCVAQFDRPFCKSKLKLNHQLFNPKIIAVLRKYGLPDSGERLQEIRTNLLCSDGYKPKSECACTPSAEQMKKKNKPIEKRWGSKSSLAESQASRQCSDQSGSDSDNESASMLDDDVDLYGPPSKNITTELTSPFGAFSVTDKILNNLNVPSGSSQPGRNVSRIEFREMTRSYILRQGGRVTLGMLTRDLGEHFPASFDMAAAIQSDKEVFGTETNDGVIHQVSCLEEIRLCSLYNSEDGCPNEGICPYLHVCIDYIAGNFLPGCKKNHSVSDQNSLRVFNKLFIDVTDPKILLRIVRNSLPQICGKYNEEGQCPAGDACRDLHVCEDKVLRTCAKKGCLNHSLTTPQCTSVMKSYAMVGLKTERLRTLIIPYKRSKTRKRHGSGESGLSSRSSVPEVIDTTSLVAEVRRYLLQQGGFVGMAKFTKDMAAQGHEFQMNSILQDRAFVIRKRDGKNSEIGVIVHGIRICDQYNRGACTNMDCKYLHLCKKYIADNCGPGCSFRHDLKDKKLKDILERLQVDVKIPQKILYILRNSMPQICRAYNDNGCLFGVDCRHLHICEEKFFGTCTKTSCLNHDIRVPMCQRVLAEYRMTNWDNNKLKSVVLPCKKARSDPSMTAATTTPPTNSASEYFTDPLTATITHVQSTAPSAATTTPLNLNQGEGGAKPKRKRRVRTEKKDQSTVGEEEDQSELNITSDSDSCQGLSTQFSEPVVEMICEANLRSKCQGDCGMLHFDLPYIWQYQWEDMWSDFSAEDCESIEKCFADANVDKWSRDLTMMTARRNGYPFYKQTDLSLSTGGATVILMFSMVTWALGDAGSTNRRSKVSVRRLGTVSYIDARPREISTRWKWFYKDADTMWTQPEESLQDKCEETYLQYCRGEGSAFMALGDTDDDCCVDFDNMKLYVDSSGHEEIDLRRRPEVVTATELEARIRGRLVAPPVPVTSNSIFDRTEPQPPPRQSPPPNLISFDDEFEKVTADPFGPTPVRQTSFEPALNMYQTPRQESYTSPATRAAPPRRPPPTYSVANYPESSRPNRHAKKDQECMIQ